jgi:hypothetical protein
MVYYKTRGVPCGFRTCIRWRALDRLLIFSAADFTIHGDINTPDYSAGFFTSPYMSNPALLNIQRLTCYIVQGMEYANDIVAFIKRGTKIFASITVPDVQQCSLRASACFSDTPLPFLHTEPQPLHIDNTTALGIETSSTETPTTPHKHILVCLFGAAIIALTCLGYNVPILPLLATWKLPLWRSSLRSKSLGPSSFYRARLSHATGLRFAMRETARTQWRLVSPLCHAIDGEPCGLPSCPHSTIILA